MHAFAFSQVSAELIILEGVEIIEYQAFMLSNATVLTIPSTIKKIAYQAFLDNYSLTKIIINKTQTDFESNVVVREGWYYSPDVTLEFLQ